MAAFTPQYARGYNIPPINTAKVGFDLTLYIGNVRATASVGGNVVASATDVATSIKLSDGLANVLRTDPLGAGIRARIRPTGEWVLITAVTGNLATVTRAQADPGGAPTVAAAIPQNAEIDIVPLDGVPVSAAVDPADATNQTAIVTLTDTQTRIPATVYDFELSFSTGSGERYRWPNAVDTATLTIVPDPNDYPTA